MSETIIEYTKGSIGNDQFRSKLSELNVPVDANLDKLIRKHESGDFISFNEFGKNIFRQLNGYSLFDCLHCRSEHYNRVDKINMNNTKIVSPEKMGKQHFAYAGEIQQPKSRQIDNLHIEAQERHLGE